MNTMDLNCHHFMHLQEESEKTGKVTSAGLYFLHFQVYKMDSSTNAVCPTCKTLFALCPNENSI